MKCLVTGGAGFIGGHVVDALLKENHEVLVIDDCSSTANDKFHFVSGAQYHNHDIRNYDLIEPHFSNVDWVFHLAAKSRIQPTINNPTETCEVNFSGTCNILEASRKNKVKRVVFSSTSSIYGLKNTPPLKEDMPTDCLNPYSVSKLAAESLCKMYYTLYGLKTVTLRYFNVFGPREPKRGEYAPVVGLFMRQKKNKDPLTVVGDGSQTRDFTHVKDVVNANLLAAKSKNKKCFGEIFNVGTGKRMSILKLAKIINSPYSHIEERKGEAKDTEADISKTKKFLNWEPKEDIKKYIKEISK